MGGNPEVSGFGSSSGILCLDLGSLNPLHKNNSRFGCLVPSTRSGAILHLRLQGRGRRRSLASTGVRAPKAVPRAEQPLAGGKLYEEALGLPALL